MACSFCGLTQFQVDKLVAGPAAYICDGCIRISMDVVVDSTPEAEVEARIGAMIAFSIDDIVAPSFARLRRLAAAALALEPNAAQRDVLARKVGGWDQAFALELVDTIPLEDQSVYTRLQVAGWHMTLDQFDEALAALTQLPDGLNDLEAVQVRIARAACRAELEPDVDAALAELDAALKALDAVPSTEGTTDVRAFAKHRGWLGRAAALRRGDRFADAQVAIDRVLAESPTDVHALWQEVVLRQAEGNERDAATLRATLEPLTHPESHRGRLLREAAGEP